ncbi:MAG: hypothetical protein GY927_00370 [bacterium]|nr:hypothetical protein [bacterium]
MNVLLGKSGVFPALLFTSIALVPGTAAAKDCNAYAQSAVSQNQQNKRMNCRFSGSAWQNNSGAHLAWCLIAPSSQVRAETRKRQRALAGCLASKGGGSSGGVGTLKKIQPRNKGKAGKFVPPGAGIGGGIGSLKRNRPKGTGSTTEAYCNGYANQALKDIKRLKSYGCIWSGLHGFTKNFDYCMKVSKTNVEKAWNIRSRKVNMCRAARNARKNPRKPKAKNSAKGWSDLCNCYANNQVKWERYFFKNFVCTVGGRRGWSEHYKFCKGATIDDIEIQAASRRSWGYDCVGKKLGNRPNLRRPLTGLKNCKIYYGR